MEHFGPVGHVPCPALPCPALPPPRRRAPEGGIDHVPALEGGIVLGNHPADHRHRLIRAGAQAHYDLTRGRTLIRAAAPPALLRSRQSWRLVSSRVALCR